MKKVASNCLPRGNALDTGMAAYAYGSEGAAKEAKRQAEQAIRTHHRSTAIPQTNA
jgi:hypothetical protein